MSSMRKLERLQEKEKRDALTANLKYVFNLRFTHYERTHKISKHVIRAIEWLKDCRTSKLGGWKHTCNCGEEVIMYKSCHNKSCPLCNGYENKQWLEFHKERLVDTKYLHIVFVLPEELNEKNLRGNSVQGQPFFMGLQLLIIYFMSAGSVLGLQFSGMRGVVS